jgi:hypothetical protein
MACPNINLESWKTLEASVGTDRAYYLWDKYDGKVPLEDYNYLVKPGIQELFDSNPELANQVYEALGFKKDIVQYYELKPENIIEDKEGKTINFQDAEEKTYILNYNCTTIDTDLTTQL